MGGADVSPAVIIVGQNLQAEAADKRAEATYKDAEAVLHECVQIQEHLSAQDAVQQREIAELKDLIVALKSR
ncbi:MAG: hypothetical protein AB7J35_13310 [Dehalococcoidia bacterium]